MIGSINSIIDSVSRTHPSARSKAQMATMNASGPVRLPVTSPVTSCGT